MMAVLRSVLFQLWISIVCCIHDYHDTTLELQIFDINFPIKSFGGVGALYDDILYGFNGKNCTSSNIDSCLNKVSYTELTLDISSIQLYDKQIYLADNPSWTAKQIDPNSVTWSINIGTGTSTSTYIDQYVFILHPGCCTHASNISLKYSLKSHGYIDPNEYNYAHPGGMLSNACNTNDGEWIYSIGGRDKMIISTGTTYRYHIVNDIWEELSDLNMARDGASCLFIGDDLYVLGGSSVTKEKLKTIEVYEAYTKKWTLLEATLHTERNQHISIKHPNNWILTIGGRDEQNRAAITELFDPISGAISTTEMMHARKQFYHAVYHYDVDTIILFVWGGNFNNIVFDDVQYVVLSTDDNIFYDITTTPSSTKITPSNNESSISSTSSTYDTNNTKQVAITNVINNTVSNDLLIILICVGSALLLICICILIFMILQKRKINNRRKSRIHSPSIRSPRSPGKARSPRSPKMRFRDVSRVEGAPKLLNQRKSSEGARKGAIDMETNKWVENEDEMNKLIKQYNNQNRKESVHQVGSISTASEDDDDDDDMYDNPSSSSEEMYKIGQEEEEQKVTPKTTRTATNSIDGENFQKFEEEKAYHWISKTLKKCDKRDWKIYFKNFKRNKMTESRLRDLDDECENVWIELIPELGPRVQFQQLWKERKMRKVMMGHKTPSSYAQTAGNC